MTEDGRGRSSGTADAPAAATRRRRSRRPEQDVELRRLRRRIDALDRRIVALLNERARLGLAAGEAKANGAGRPVHDPEREREVLLRVAMSNAGPLAQADLLAIYRRLIAATRSLEHRARRSPHDAGDGGEPQPD